MTNSQIKDLYNQYTEARAARLDADKAAKAAKAVEDNLFDQLKAAIPENAEKAGIKHTVTGRSVRYAQALPVIQDRLIPKTKYDELQAILEEYTTVGTKHTFKVTE